MMRCLFFSINHAVQKDLSTLRIISIEYEYVYLLFSFFQHKNCANLTRFLGVNLCGHVSLPMAYRDYNSPYFPLSGDSSFGMTFHTTNPKLARFEVETRTLRSKDENRYDWIFNVHVPGLTFGRKVVGNSTFQFLDDGKYLSVSCGIHDYKFGRFEAKYNNITNRLHTKFSTPRMAYLRPITVETEVSKVLVNFIVIKISIRRRGAHGLEGALAPPPPLFLG